MALSRLQSEILRLIAAHRDPESYIAGSTPLNRDRPRFSGDIDVFHDREERIARAALEDSVLLRANGFDLEWLRREPNFYSAIINREAEATKLEWALDSDFRFFPTQPDETFGYVLHPMDLATNKVLAAAGRREPRDIVDALTIHEKILPLGAVIWAASGKSIGFTPEGLINEIRRLSHYTDADFRRLASDPPIDPGDTIRKLRRALADAEDFVARMPTDKVGLLFLDGAKIVQPDPNRLDTYSTHAGKRRGQWPASTEITAAMFERYNR